MKEMLIKSAFYCLVIILAAIIAPKTRMEGDFLILAGLGIIIIQNLFIRWALMAQQEKAEGAPLDSKLTGPETPKQ